MSGHGFVSALAGDLDAYLAFKKDMGGRDTAARACYLRKFDTWCTEHGRAVADQNTVEGWVRAQLECPGRSRSWMSCIRDFGRWRQATGHADAYVLTGRWKAPICRPQPYLLSRRDIDAFFAAATALQIASPWRWQAAAFFALMHSCGLRTCEVRRLRATEVDFEDEHIDIIWSKGNRSRRLPVTPDVMQVLDACNTESRARFPGRSHFFVSATGNQVDPATTGKMFARIWDQAGLARPVNGRQPVPYALRHHFAYACIERWRIHGMDITAMLPYLSAYMGHSSFASTYYYIHTSPDFLAAYDDITTASQDLLPEVGWGE